MARSWAHRLADHECRSGESCKFRSSGVLEGHSHGRRAQQHLTPWNPWNGCSFGQDPPMPIGRAPGTRRCMSRSPADSPGGHSSSSTRSWFGATFRLKDFLTPAPAFHMKWKTSSSKTVQSPIKKRVGPPMSWSRSIAILESAHRGLADAVGGGRARWRSRVGCADACQESRERRRWRPPTRLLASRGLWSALHVRLIGGHISYSFQSLRMPLSNISSDRRAAPIAGEARQHSMASSLEWSTASGRADVSKR